MSDERALAWQETTRDLERLPVPKLALCLHVGWLEAGLREGRLTATVLRCSKEAQFRGHAEVGDGKVAYFLQDRVSTELEVDLLRRVQVMDRKRRDLHDVANVEEVEPLALVQIAEQYLHIDGVFQAWELAVFVAPSSACFRASRVI